VTPRIRAVLFDLDGTLIATRQLYVECYAAALAPHVGRHMSEDEIMDMKPGAETVFLPELAGAAAADACVAAFYRHYDDLHGTRFRGIYDGVPDMLAALRALDLPLGIFTGKSRRAWDITARHVDLGTFDALVFGDEVPRQKPAPDGLHLVLDQLSLAPDEVIYIGDSTSDLGAAAAGMPAGGVLWSKRHDELDAFRDHARAVGAQAFATPADLAAWVSANASD
jgi:HAD superfamily hydrolase (TIGR01549 family)